MLEPMEDWPKAVEDDVMNALTLTPLTRDEMLEVLANVLQRILANKPKTAYPRIM